MKVCTKCKVERPLSDYHRYSRSPDGHAWSCKICAASYGAERRKDPAFRERKRENSFMFSYGITVTEYEDMFSKQNGLCAICDKPETKLHSRTKKVLPLCVDHCHNSKNVRGLLCSQCNLMLGLANDDVARLKQAIAYLSGGENQTI